MEETSRRNPSPTGQKRSYPITMPTLKIGLRASAYLRERVRLVGHVAELRLVLRMAFHVCRKHRLAAVVLVSGPVEHLEPTALRGQEGSRRVGDRRAEERGPAGYCGELQEVVAA